MASHSTIGDGSVGQDKVDAKVLDGEQVIHRLVAFWIPVIMRSWPTWLATHLPAPHSLSPSDFVRSAIGEGYIVFCCALTLAFTCLASNRIRAVRVFLLLCVRQNDTAKTVRRRPPFQRERPQVIQPI
jgi:hypothetical protein